MGGSELRRWAINQSYPFLRPMSPKEPYGYNIHFFRNKLHPLLMHVKLFVFANDTKIYFMRVKSFNLTESCYKRTLGD